VLQEGKADFIAIGRPLLADPDWANKVREGRLEDIRPCIGDHEGCHKRLYERKLLSCTVNPACGMEREFVIRPAERKKSVLVVGGGPGGMEAARVAALRGHTVTLLEEEDVLGGKLIPAAVPGFKEEYRKLLSYLCTQIEKLGVNVRLGQEASPELIEEIEPEVLFIATGGKAILPEIPGIERKEVITAVDLLLGKREAGESVIVMGGGLVGCETALYLAEEGKKVTIVEILDSVMRDVYSINRIHLEKMLTDRDVRILTRVEVREISGKGIALTDQWGKISTLKADTVVVAIGFKPDEGLLGSLRGKVAEVYPIGDCVLPRRVINAMWEGFRIARFV